MHQKSLIIKQISNSIINLKSTNFPQEVLDIAKNLIVDISGVTIAGSTTQSAKLFYALAEEIYSSGSCKIIGMNKFLNPSGSAFVNGASGHALDFDDNCYAGIVHGSAVVFPAVLAYSQHKQLSGKDLLKGFIIGLEIQFALAKAFTNEIYDKGWWTTSVFGSIGSTAGVASISGLNQRDIENALSISASGVGAIRAIRGTDAKHFYCGKSAENGIISSNLAQRGASGPIDVFEDQNGLKSILNDKNFDNQAIKNIGTKFSLLDPGVDIKKYPVCYASHSASDGIKFILETKKINPEEIKEINCVVPKVIASNLTYNYPQTVKEAQFSMQFSIAMIIRFGSIKLEYLNKKYILDKKTKILMKKIKIIVGNIPKSYRKSKLICPEWTNVKLILKNGNSYEKFIGAPTGSAIKPLDKQSLFNKFQSCIQYSEVNFNIENLYEKLNQIESINNCNELF